MDKPKEETNESESYQESSRWNHGEQSKGGNSSSSKGRRGDSNHGGGRGNSK